MLINSKCNQGKGTSTIFKEQEEEKKRKHQQRLLDVEMGSFTPLVLEPTVEWEPTATASRPPSREALRKE